MVERAEDKPLKNGAADQEKTALSKPLHGIMPLLEEESENSVSGLNKGDVHAAPDPTDALDTLNVHADKLNALKNLLVEEGEQDAPFDARSSTDSRISHPEAHALRDKPETAAKVEIPETLPVEKPADTPSPRLRPVLTTLFALIVVAGFVAIAWVDSALSDRIDQLELQHSTSQKEIASINRRMHELEVIISSLKINISKAAQPMSYQIPDIILPNQSLPSPDEAGHH